MEILKKWEEHDDPLSKYLDQFLSVYRDLLLNRAGVLDLAEMWLGRLNCQRNGKCYVLEENLIIFADALFSDLSKKKFPDLKLFFEFTVSAQGKALIKTKFNIIAPALNFEELERLYITNNNQGVSTELQSEWRKNKDKWKGLEDVSQAFESLFNNLISWNIVQKRYLDEFHRELIERFGSHTLKETQDTPTEFGQIGKTWNFVFKVDGTDLCWSVKMEVCLKNREDWLLIETCSTNYKISSGRVHINIKEDVHDSVGKVRDWIEVNLPPNISR